MQEVQNPPPIHGIVKNWNLISIPWYQKEEKKRRTWMCWWWIFEWNFNICVSDDGDKQQRNKKSKERKLSYWGCCLCWQLTGTMNPFAEGWCFRVTELRTISTGWSEEYSRFHRFYEYFCVELVRTWEHNNINVVVAALRVAVKTSQQRGTDRTPFGRPKN